MKKNWIGISVLSCTAASLLLLGVAWKKQHEMVQLELNDRNANCWIENEYRRHEKIEVLDNQSKKIAMLGGGLIMWPFAYLFYHDIQDAYGRARLRRIKHYQREKTK